MELFLLNQDVDALESRVAMLHGMPKLFALVYLAWHLRQRDDRRALALADDADLLLAKNKIQDAELRRLSARLMLLRAEIRLQHADLMAARQLNTQAAAMFAMLDDALGLGDSHWLNASIEIDSGHAQSADVCLALALQAYRQGGDLVREQCVEARRFVYAAFRNPSATAQGLPLAFQPENTYPAAVMTWLAMAQASVVALTDDPALSIKYYLQAYHAALDCGQLRQAMVAANNAGGSFCVLGDLEAGLEWRDKSLALARHTGWPFSIGASLVPMADTMRLLTRFGEARACLQEALALLAHLPGSRNYKLALKMLGQLELDVGHPQAGLAAFEALQAQTLADQERMEPDLLIIAWFGQARALLLLEQPDLANSKALAALQLAREHSNVEGQVNSLHILAKLHTRFDLPAPEGMTAPSATLHYLHLAFEAGGGMSGYSMASELYTHIAEAYAACGNYEAAYINSQAAAAAYQKTHSAMVEKRALALQIRYEMERAHAETEHHRQVAATLKETTATLEILGITGREITASLNANDVFMALDRHVHHLLDACSLMVFLMQPDQTSLSMAFGMENGLPLPPETIPLDDPLSDIARCARERKEVRVELAAEHSTQNLMPGTLDTLSLLFAPLMAGDRLLGVMSIQSASLCAYGEREVSVFLALSAYGAIALDNAAAYAVAGEAQKRADQALSDLRQTQGELIQREKLASLGSLVAGVAHELNTPIGNGLLVASTICEDSTRFLQQVQQGGVRRSDLEQFCQNSEESSALLMRCLMKAAALITSFKQLAVDQTSDQRRVFDLRTECDDVALMLGSRLRGTGHELELDIAEHLQMDSYPGAFGQVFSNLLINALVHGLEGRSEGRITVTARARDTQSVLLIFKDNGCGIRREHLDRIFEPFFTTQLGQGGSGLGLHISYNIIRSVLGGSIRLISQPEEGAAFEIILPLVAPSAVAG